MRLPIRSAFGFLRPQIQVRRFRKEVAEMIWVGSFKSLQSALRTPLFTDAPLEVHTWLRSEIGLISPFVDWLMSLMAGSRCVAESRSSLNSRFGKAGLKRRGFTAQFR
jgi:hypothetical protein